MVIKWGIRRRARLLVRMYVRDVYKTSVRSPEEKEQLEKPGHRWVDSVEIQLKGFVHEGVDWIQLLDAWGNILMPAEQPPASEGWLCSVVSIYFIGFFPFVFATTLLPLTSVFEIARFAALVPGAWCLATANPVSGYMELWLVGISYPSSHEATVRCRGTWASATERS